MREISFLIFCFLSAAAFSQVVLSADGPGNTYGLINSVLAPGYNATETPDCGHSAFGEHIDEVYDNELNMNVFRFVIHVAPDDDRCINFDRQRNEIKTYDQSPPNLLGIENEGIIYKWKFKLPAGFQSSPKFTHIHQLKSVGDQFDNMPVYTLTTRKGSPDRLELRYAEAGTQVTLNQVDIAPFLDTWVSVTETIEYTTPGTYSIEIKKVSDNSLLFSYSNGSMATWRTGAAFIRPKWGIYRSLLYPQDLRDEEILYADFSIEEFVPVSNGKPVPAGSLLKAFPNPVSKALLLSGLPKEAELIQVFGSDGRKVLEETVRSKSMVKLDVSLLPAGTYFLRLGGEEVGASQVVFVKE